MNSRKLLENINSFHKKRISSDECNKLLVDYISTVDGFVIFGAMHTGIEIKRMLERFSAPMICFFDEVNKQRELDGLRIIHSFEDLLREIQQRKVCFVIASNVPKSMRIMQGKLCNHFDNVQILDKEPIYFSFHKGAVKNNGISISMFGLLPYNVCTLKCNGCCYMIPQVQSKYRINFPIENLKKEITNLSNIVDYIVNFEILGGEPTLHPHLAELMDHIRNCSNIFQIVLVTNGTIIPSNDVLDAIERNRIIVRISDYGEYSKNKYKLIDALKKRNVIYFMRPAGEFPWTDYGEFHDRGGDGSLQWEKCRDRGNCIEYCGKIWPCGRAFRQIENNLYNEKLATFVNLYDDIDKARKDLVAMLERTEPTYGCRYCGNMDKTIEAGRQLP